MNNQINLVGHAGKDPESKTFEDTNNTVVKFSLAVKEYSSNTEEDKTLWIEVVAWNGLAERVLKTVTKGREIVVSGKLSLSTYTKEVDGVKVQVTKPIVKLSSFHLCGKKPVADETQTEEKANGRKSKKEAAIA
jgi:single-strand DNA-binding protein